MHLNSRNGRSVARLASLATLFGVSLLGGLAGCSSFPSLKDLTTVAGDKVLGVVTPYRMEVVQGNVVTKEMSERVKPGMSRAQVRDLLGSPMLTDVFHSDRWDYDFTIRRQGTAPQERHVFALFDGDKLKALEIPQELPTENEFVASINTFTPKGPEPKLELTDAQRKALPSPAKTQAKPSTDEPLGAARSYPPLEPNS